jgi:hypothetical protein
MIGRFAGYHNIIGNNNVFLGSGAGYNETGSNKLYISNSNTSTPLIYGEFDNQYLEINGDLTIIKDGPASNITMAYGNSAWANAAIFQAARARGTQASPLPLQNQDRVFAFESRVFDGSVNRLAASIYTKIDGQVSDNVTPQMWVFSTMDRSGTFNNRMVIRHDGKIGFGVFNPTHSIELAGGAYSDGSSWVDASSRELKDDINDLSASVAMETLEGLNPVTFKYKTDLEKTEVGFIAEDVPELVATKDRKGLSSIDIFAVLTKVVQEQQKKDLEQQKLIEELLTKIGELETTLQFKQDKEADLAQAN